jgi:hypothetical protein
MSGLKLMGTLLMLITFASFSQTNSPAPAAGDKKSLASSDEVIHTLLVLDRNVLENAKVLIHDLETKETLYNETARFHAEEMGRSLNQSESYLSRIGKATDLAIDEIGIGYLAGLHRHYLNAIAAQRAIQEELGRPSPAKKVLRMKTAVIYAELKKAEVEQLEFDTKEGIKEPEPPRDQ